MSNVRACTCRGIVHGELDHRTRWCDNSACRNAGRMTSLVVATVARRWAGNFPGSGERGYRRNPEVIFPAIFGTMEYPNVYRKTWKIGFTLQRVPLSGGEGPPQDLCPFGERAG